MNPPVTKSAKKPAAKTAARTAAKKRASKTAAKSVAKKSTSKTDAKAMPANAERLMTLLLAPVISEKSTQIADRNAQVVFRVVPAATKPEIKAAVELMFKVDVRSVQVASVHGKTKRFGQHVGRRRGWKKAYVSLAPGQEINFAQEA